MLNVSCGYLGGGEEEKIQFDTTVVCRPVRSTLGLESFVKDKVMATECQEIPEVLGTLLLVSQEITAEILLGGFISLDSRDLWRQKQLSGFISRPV